MRLFVRDADKQDDADKAFRKYCRERFSNLE